MAESQFYEKILNFLSQVKGLDWRLVKNGLPISGSKISGRQTRAAAEHVARQYHRVRSGFGGDSHLIVPQPIEVSVEATSAADEDRKKSPTATARWSAGAEQCGVAVRQRKLFTMVRAGLVLRYRPDMFACALAWRASSSCIIVCRVNQNNTPTGRLTTPGRKARWWSQREVDPATVMEDKAATAPCLRWPDGSAQFVDRNAVRYSAR